MLKKVGAYAREVMERFFGCKINLQLWVKVKEDWRNREKWDAYEEAVDEMLARTSTERAPWHILESVDKRYARIKAMRLVIGAIRQTLDR